MQRLKLFRILLLVFFAVVFGVTLFFSLFDFGYFKPRAEEAIRVATGRTFRINGGLSLRLLPRPRILIENATLASPERGSREPMLHVGRAYVAVELLSLLKQPVVISELELQDVNVLLETGPNDALNWQLSPASQENPTETPQASQENSQITLDLPIRIRTAKIENIQLSYRKAPKQSANFLLKSLSIAPDDVLGAKVKGHALLNNELALELTANVSPQHAEIAATVNNVATNVILEYSPNSVSFSASLDTLANAAQLLAIDNLPNEILRLTGALTLNNNGLALDAFEAKLEELELSANGAYNLKNKTAALTLAASGKRLSALQQEFPDVPFSFSANVNTSEQKIDIKPFVLTLADSSLEGTAKVEIDKPLSLKLDAVSELLDLSPFLTGEDNQEPNVKSPEKPTPKASPSRYVFTDEPLNLSALSALNADVTLRIDHLKTGSGQLKKLSIKTKLNAGVLDLQSQFQGELGGEYKSTIALDASQPDVKFEMLGEVNALKIAMLSGADVPSNEIPETNVMLDLKTAGASARTLASSLDGSVLFSQGPGKVNNDLIETFSGDIVSQLINTLNPFASKDRFTIWDCSIIALHFTSGVGAINGFLLESEKLMVVGGGGIDLNTEKLNFEFNTKPRKGVGVSADMFVTPFVKLTGTLANPNIGLNKKGVLLSGGAAVLTGGMSFLYKGLMDRATAEGSRCEQVLSAVEHQTSEHIAQ